MEVRYIPLEQKIKLRKKRNSINDATPEEWDQSAKSVGWGAAPPKEKATEKQVGGQHYKKFRIQPAEFCHINNIPYLEATAIKYLCRWKDKGGIQDLDKAIHFIELLKEFSNESNTRRV